MPAIPAVSRRALPYRCLSRVRRKFSRMGNVFATFALRLTPSEEKYMPVVTLPPTSLRATPCKSFARGKAVRQTLRNSRAIACSGALPAKVNRSPVRQRRQRSCVSARTKPSPLRASPLAITRSDVVKRDGKRTSWQRAPAAYPKSRGLSTTTKASSPQTTGISAIWRAPRRMLSAIPKSSMCRTAFARKLAPHPAKEC